MTVNVTLMAAVHSSEIKERFAFSQHEVSTDMLTVCGGLNEMLYSRSLYTVALHA